MSAGYGVDGIFDALVEGINSLSGPDLRFDHFQPASPEWNEAMRLLTKLYEDGSLILVRFRWNDPYNRPSG